MKSKLNQLVARLTDPRKLILLAALLAAMGLVAGYVQVQIEVDRTLALRQGPPPAVAVQSFQAARDTGPAREVQVFAEADFNNAVVLRVRGSDPERRALVVPLLEVSEIGSTLIDANTDRSKAALSAQVSRRDLSPDPEGIAAVFGALIHPLFPGEPAPDPRELASEVFGQGENGSVVTINGTRLRDNAMIPMADGAFIAQGLVLSEELLAVAPYANGRIAYLSAPINTESHEWVYVLALILGVAAVFFYVRRTIFGHEGIRASARDYDMPDESSASHNAAHPKFAPIPSQEELSAKPIEADDDETVVPMSRMKAVVGFVQRRLEARRAS